MPATAAPSSKARKRRYTIDPQVAHERASRAARVRNSPDGYITALARAELTAGQKRRLAALLMPWLREQHRPAEDEPSQDGAHDAA